MHRRAIVSSMFLSQFMTQNQNNYLQLFQTLCYVTCRGVGEVRPKRNTGTLEDQYLRDLLNLIQIYWDASQYFHLLLTTYTQDFSFAQLSKHTNCVSWETTGILAKVLGWKGDAGNESSYQLKQVCLGPYSPVSLQITHQMSFLSKPKLTKPEQ